jgi:hypothetical protein
MIDISNEQKNEIVSKIGFYCERPTLELRFSRNQVSKVDHNVLGDAKCAGWNTISIDDEVTKLNGESISKWLPLKIYEYVTSTDISSVSFTNAQLRRMEKNQNEVERKAETTTKQMRMEMTPEGQTAKKQKRKEDNAQRYQRKGMEMTPEEQTAKKQKRKEDKKQKRKEDNAQRYQRRKSTEVHGKQNK